MWLLVLFCAVYIAWGLTDSIQAPFYPIEAEKKGQKLLCFAVEGWATCAFR